MFNQDGYLLSTDVKIENTCHYDFGLIPKESDHAVFYSGLPNSWAISIVLCSEKQNVLETGVGVSPPFHQRMETDSGSEMFYSFRMIDNGRKPDIQ
jgi:hypothetical protein